ncbi:MAG: hypothetical protein ACM3SQ_14530 [Betaproteobacteria bacterium]
MLALASLLAKLKAVDPAALAAVFTGVIAVATVVQVIVYWQMKKTGYVVERAWISLETLSLENFEFSPTETDGSHGKMPRGVIRLKNSGNTPAFIDRAKVLMILTDNPNEELPPTPPYHVVTWAHQRNQPPSVLVAGEATNWRNWFEGQFVTPAILGQIQRGDRQMWIVGLIEYRDAFKKSHTYGFARKYDGSLADKALGRRFAHVHDPHYSYAD